MQVRMYVLWQLDTACSAILNSEQEETPDA
jgi:hypothetical protein